MQELLRMLSLKPFDGNTLEGPRKDFIYDWLKENELNPKEDSHGNIWVKKNGKGREKVYSSHIDIDMTSTDVNNGIRESQNDVYGKVLKGTLDNAVGCYMNMMLAKTDDSKYNNSFVFTLSEEENPKNTDIWGRSAESIANDYKNSDKIPSLFVSVDITYPTPKFEDKVLFKMEDDEWDRLSKDELFDNTDMTRCYIDGFSYGRNMSHVDSFEYQNNEPVIKNILDGYGNSNIKIRKFFGFDEATMYSKIAPAFSFGPVFYGKPDLPGQIMPERNLTTAEKFLDYTLSIEVKN